jgi:hypothetical protein
LTDTQQALQHAIEAIQSGKLETGQRLLAQILHADPKNVQAWLWMSKVVDTEDQRRECLLRALALDPQNQAARAALLKSSNTVQSRPDLGLQEIATAPTAIPSTKVLAQDTTQDPIQHNKNHLQVMLAGAMTLTLLCGLLLLLLTLTQLIPQARERIELVAEPPAPTATLWCLECERAGRPVVLQARIGRGFLGGGKAGELPHGTLVSVLDHKRAVLEQRYYAEVAAEGQRGWVPETQIQRWE